MKKVLLAQNIAREGAGVIGEILSARKIPFDSIDLSAGDKFPPFRDYAAFFVFGGPDSANDRTEKMQHELESVRKAVAAGIPYFGICLGMQVLCKAMGGTVRKNEVREIGFRGPDHERFRIALTREGVSDPIFAGLPSQIGIFHLHGETGELAPGMKRLASGKFCQNQVVKAGKCAYGFQGHLELTGEMFQDWLDEDADLRALDRKALEKDFGNFGKGLEESGKRIIGNFLSVAGL